MSPLRWFLLLSAFVCITSAITQFEGARARLHIDHDYVGATPVSIYRLPSPQDAPAVVMTHGFGGSRQGIEAYAISLAQSGYVVVSYDLLGHGRHPDTVSLSQGFTQNLLNQTHEVVDFTLGLPWVDGRVSLLGQGLASDIMVRYAAQDTRIGPVIALSVVSDTISATHPDMLLMINGAFEKKARQDAISAMQLVSPSADEGRSVAGNGVLRRAVVTPGIGRIGMVNATNGMREARDWLNLAFGKTDTGPMAKTGMALGLLLFGLVLLGWPMAAFFPQGAPHDALTLGEFWITATVPTLVTPLVLVPLNTDILPVLGAGYLALHMLVYGALLLIVLRGMGHRIGPRDTNLAIGLALLCIVVIGGLLDRYVLAFMPAGGRPFLIVAIAIGALPYMLAEAKLLEAGHAGFVRSFAARVLFLGSILLAVTLDFERLRPVLFVLPYMAAFFVIFGTFGGCIGRRTGSVTAVGLGLAGVLAWTLGVTFPMITG